MSIWVYNDTLHRPVEDEVARDTCLFCSHPLESIERRVLFSELKGELKACSVCGWWCKNSRSSVSRPEDGRYYTMHGACAQLRNLDLANINAPLQEINDLPLARFDLRFEIHPRKFEELVASVFQQIGYDAAATAYHADGGIDVVLHGDGVGTAGVQVKRYRDRIEAEQIRAFAGALVLGGYTRDVFVTTSSFRSGAVASAQRFAGRGVPIELLDADKFYDALKMARRPPYEDFEDWYAEISDVEDSVIYDGEGPF